MNNTTAVTEISCKLDNAALVTKVREWVRNLAMSGGRDWTLSVPVNFERDPDMLIEELCKRFNATLFQAEGVIDIIFEKISKSNLFENDLIYNIGNKTDSYYIAKRIFKEGFLAAMSAYRSMPLEDKGKEGWIRVEDGTPPFIEGKDYSENVFAWCNDELMIMCYCLLPDDNNELCYSWCNCYGKIDGDGEFDDNYYPTHWQPLPSPPTSLIKQF